MATLSSEDFPEVTTSEDLDDVMSTGYAPSGEPGTPEHAMNVADALGYADGDIYWDYAAHASDAEGYRSAAATSANISSLQVATAYCADVMRALAADPELLATVQAAMSASRAPSP